MTQEDQTKEAKTKGRIEKKKEKYEKRNPRKNNKPGIQKDTTTTTISLPPFQSAIEQMETDTKSYIKPSINDNNQPPTNIIATSSTISTTGTSETITIPTATIPSPPQDGVSKDGVDEESVQLKGMIGIDSFSSEEVSGVLLC